MRRSESVSGGLEKRTDGPAVSCNHRLSHLNAINVSEPVYLLIAVIERNPEPDSFESCIY